MDDNALYWVTRNRARRDSVRRAGEFVGWLSDGVESEHGGLRDAAQLIAGVVEGEFHDHCRVGAVQGNSVVIYVDEPGMIAPMRLRWSTNVLRALQAQKEFKAVRRVIFDHGRNGASVCRGHLGGLIS